MNFAIVHNLPFGGAKRVLWEQVKRLSINHTIDLFTLSITDETRLSLKPFVRKHEEEKYDLPEKFPWNIKSVLGELKDVYRKMGEKINKGNYDAVYVHPCFLTQAPYILRYLNKPSVYFCQEPKREFYEYIPRVSNFFNYYLTFPFRLPLKRVDYDNTRMAAKILVNSRFSKNRIDEIYGVTSEVNYPGVDTATFSPMPAVSEIPEKFVLTVGDLSLHKGHDFLIRSLSLIPQKQRPVLIIVGSYGAELNYLLKLAGRKRVEIRIINNVNDRELAEFYNRAMLYVYAARNEPFGLTVLEALACGKYVLAVDEGGIGEIITDKRLGMLVERDEKIFAKELNRILKFPLIRGSHRQNPDATFRYNWVKKNWSWGRSVTELEKFL